MAPAHASAPLRPQDRDQPRPVGRRRAAAHRPEDVERVDEAGDVGERHGGGAVDVLRLAVGPEAHALDARQVEARAYLRHGPPPEVAGRLAHAPQPHGLDPAPLLLAGVGHHGLHLGHRPVAHAHPRAVGLHVMWLY